jgi:hypothetical protein
MTLWRVSHLSDYKLTRAFHTLPADGLQETKISQQQIRQVCFCLDSLTFLNILRTAPGLGGRLLIKGLRKTRGRRLNLPRFSATQIMPAWGWSPRCPKQRNPSCTDYNTLPHSQLHFALHCFCSSCSSHTQNPDPCTSSMAHRQAHPTAMPKLQAIPKSETPSLPPR